MKNEEQNTTEEIGLVHFNARVPKPMKETVKRTAKRARINMEDLAQDAWRVYFGLTDKLLETRRMLALEAFKQETKGTKIPFDWPAAPFMNNDHNGIVGVPGSSPGDSTSLIQHGNGDIAHGSAVIGKHGVAVERADTDKAADGTPFSRHVGFKLETAHIPS